MYDIQICNLYSGSGGNCTFIHAGGANILIDAGKSARRLCSALADIGVDIDSIDAIFVTHEHRDHTSALQSLSHRHHIPIHMSVISAEIFRGLMDERLCNCLTLYRGTDFSTTIKGLRIKAFQTPHDSMASVGYRLSFTDDGGNEISICYATDTGHVTDLMRENFKGCYAAVIESNHDPDMLVSGPYPEELKCRISSLSGHLSNQECAGFTAYLCDNGAKHIMLAHLSKENNTPSLAYSANLSAIRGKEINLRVAMQDDPVWLIGNDNSVL